MSGRRESLEDLRQEYIQKAAVERKNSKEHNPDRRPSDASSSVQDYPLVGDKENAWGSTNVTSESVPKPSKRSLLPRCLRAQA
jgi:hypothetical protein